ncbi:hypothetical protein [Agarivorans sp. DSG3-1]|uniref:hypothetical protein n=1 Tax=Agarivorans sp. DSG3-1 TaxID=3342249 RepID=UPI00398E5250
MFSEVNHPKKVRVISGLKRFYTEGYIYWSNENLEKLFGGELSDIDMLLLQDLQEKGFISMKCDEECCIEVLRKIK